VVEMASIGTKIKEAATKAAKEKVSGDKNGKKDKRTGGSGGSESGVDKAKRAVTTRLK
jgi:hypothetical protein